MTPPDSLGFGYWESMSTCGTTKTDAAGARVNSHRHRGPDTRKEHPTARLSGPCPGKVWHRVQELAGRARKRLPRGSANRDARSLPGVQERHHLACSKDATSVLDAFHIVKLAGNAPGEVCRRAQQDTTCHRGCKGNPLYQIRLLLRASHDRLTKRQQERLREAFTADEAHISVEVAYHCDQQVRDVFHQPTPAQGRRLATHLIKRLLTCPIPEIARLGRTLRKWKDAFLAYFDTAGASNGIIELGRRTARGYRAPTSYQLRMLPIAGGLDTSTHTQL